ncbi:hypothetical protein LSH36_195g06004 [Paralvinella palmiformis]|uniref:SHSP domain-containing protein n=1 Tax=Paralvinella palmiformis TaxID=53620 RepID=A0AAD9JPY6_9ANNE|nr:hypothetical protein LSH36_195g06004 [Paralvinella palmiformis]
MAQEGQKCVSTLVIQPSGGSTSSSSIVSTTASSSMTMESSSSFSSSASSTSSKTVSSMTTKTVKQMTTKTVKTSSMVTKSSSKNVSVKTASTSFSDAFGKDFGIDVDAEMKKLMSGADAELKSIREKFFKLEPLALTGGKTSDLVKIDSKSINDYIDKSHDDRLKFNFDVQEFETESINVQSDGNKIVVHAKKRVKKGDEEKTEEYSRTYELPTSGEVNSEKITSSVFKDGVLTVELPISEAIDAK